METEKKELEISPFKTERDRLELVDKKVEIQKKRVEIKREKLNMDETILRRKIAVEEQRMLLEKISELRYLLSDWTVDEERTLMASEPFLTPTILGERREFVLRKLMELIKKI